MLDRNRLTLAPVVLVAVLVVLNVAAAPAAARAAEGELVVFAACFVGSRAPGEAPPSGDVLSRGELTEALADWSPETDTPELRRTFALYDIYEVARIAGKTSTAGRLLSTFNVRGEDWILRVEAQHRAEGEVLARVELWRNGKLLFAPQHVGRLGERAILSAFGGDEPGFVFLTIEVREGERTREPAGHPVGRGVLGEVLSVDGRDVLPPKRLAEVPAEYTAEARAARIQGVVILQLVLDEEGRVADVRALKGLPYGLTEAAITAVRQWRFEPAHRNGLPVAVEYNVTINFRM
jgi:TonB family protein